MTPTNPGKEGSAVEMIEEIEELISPEKYWQMDTRQYGETAAPEDLRFLLRAFRVMREIALSRDSRIAKYGLKRAANLELDKEFEAAMREAEK